MRTYGSKSSLVMGILVGFGILFPPLLVADDRGLAIAEEAWRRDRGFGNFGAHITLVIQSKGVKKERRLRTRTLETPTGDKSISIFDAPNDVKGVARLTYAHEDGQDDQWLYIPDFKRVKRISNAQDSSPFMGTDFAFEDLGSQRPEEVGSFTYQFLREAPCENPVWDCFIIERTPLNPYSGYSKQIIHIDSSEYRSQKIEYFDREGKRLKTLTYSNYQRFKHRYWRPMMMVMVNQQTGNTTDVIWSKYKFQNKGRNYRERNFTPERLLNVR